MKKQWLKIICLGLALITISLTALACPSNGGSTQTTTVSTTTPPASTEVPVVNIERVAPNNLDLAGRTEVALATSGEGALVVNEAARIWVPPGAVASDTPVTLKVFIEAPENITTTVTDAPEVSVVSNFYDLGPDNTEFDKPVTVTLSYAEEDLPAGADENNIGPVYYDGQNWVPLERQIDTEKNTISFAVSSFPGEVVAVAFGYGLSWVGVTGVGAVVVGTGAIIGYKTYKWWIKDPVYYGKAAEYVTPNDPTVQQYAAMSKVKLMGSSTKLDIKGLQNNPQAIADLEKAVDADGYAGFIQFFDNNVEKPMTYNVSWNPDDWQKPGDFFKNGMVGDCKNVANGIGSILRSYGYQAKCMDGYTNGVRHAWIEVKIGDQMYYVGSRGELMTLEGATKYLQLTRSENKNGETFQWDENGQKPYKKNWWVDKLTVTVGNSLAFPGGQVTVEVFGAVGTALDIELAVEASDKTKTPYSGTTDAATGKLLLTVQLKKDAPIGVYYATAYNKVNDLSEIGIFCVDKLEIAAGMANAQAAPGEEIGINVRLNYPVVAKITIDNVQSSWTTAKDGSAFIVLNIPENAKLQVYTLTVRASDYGISTQVKYTVTVPPTLKVEIKNKEVAPGGTLDVNVTVLPPQVTRITIQGYDGRWSTDANGLANPKLPIAETVKPGQYQLTVEAPQLELIESDSYKVTLTPASQIGLSDINVVEAELGINIEGSNDEADYEAQIFIGGQFVRVSGTDSDNIYASGTVDTNSGQGEMYYEFTMRQDLALVSSGVLDLVVPDTNETYHLDFYNVPRNTTYEAQFKTENGLDALVYSISGTEVINHIRGLSIGSSELGSVNRYFAVSDSELIVILVAATESQITQLLEEY
jgi:hypothetical protein